MFSLRGSHTLVCGIILYEELHWHTHQFWISKHIAHAKWQNCAEAASAESYGVMQTLKNVNIFNLLSTSLGETLWYILLINFVTNVVILASIYGVISSSWRHAFTGWKHFALYFYSECINILVQFRPHALAITINFFWYITIHEIQLSRSYSAQNRVQLCLSFSTTIETQYLRQK